MSTPLQMHQSHDGHEIADMQASRCRVEPHITGRDTALQQSGNALGMLIQQAAPSELVQQSVRHRFHDRQKIDA
jgi:hypothetical protein